jgi:hypothetical protein
VRRERKDTGSVLFQTVDDSQNSSTRKDIHVEVQYQPWLTAGQTQVRKHRRSVNLGQTDNRFHLYNHLLVHKDIEPVRALDSFVFIFERNRFLSFDVEAISNVSTDRV